MDWTDIVLLAAFAVVYIILSRWLLPRMGVPT